LRISSLLHMSVMLAAAGVVGCIEPTQYGGPIHVEQAGVEARLRRLCGVTEQTQGCATLVAPGGEEAPDGGPAE